MNARIRTLGLALALVALASLASARGDEGTRTKSFTVSKGGTLEISTGVGDVHIKPWDKNEVVVTVDGLDDEELQRVKMTQNGNTVRVSFRPSWGSHSGHVLFEASVPAQFNLDMNTSGGDITIAGTMNGKIDGSTAGGDIKIGTITGGPVEMSTSGGDIEAGNMQGDGRLKTAGGDIKVGAVNGTLEVATSGGDITVESVAKSLEAKTAGGDIQIGDVGGEARVSTSGGGISVGKVSGKVTMSTAGGDLELKGASGRVVARTSGGDVRLRGVTGSIEAKTAGGEVDAELVPSGKGDSKLTSAGGNIRLAVPENAKVTIEATIRIDGWGRRAERYKVRSEFKQESYETDTDAGEIRAVYKLNGGGDLIELQTVNADIDIRKLR